MRIIASAQGIYHSLFLTDTGEVFGWGDNSEGELGDGTKENHFRPVRAIGITDKVVQIGAGDSNSLALTNGGEVFTWGWNGYGQQKEGIPKQSLTPKKIDGITEKVIAISCGIRHSMALTESGEIFGWGDNYYGQLGDGTTSGGQVPVKVKGLKDKGLGISAGPYHSLAYTNKGEVFRWGAVIYNHPETDEKLTDDIPQQLEGIKDRVVRLVSGDCHGLALTNTGEVYSWGDNVNFQLGDGTNFSRQQPAKVMGINEKVEKIAAGFYHSIVITEDSKVYGWGVNAGTTMSAKAPTLLKVPTLLDDINPIVLDCIFGPGGYLVENLELERIVRITLGSEIEL